MLRVLCARLKFTEAVLWTDWRRCGPRGTCSYRHSQDSASSSSLTTSAWPSSLARPIAMPRARLTNWFTKLLCVSYTQPRNVWDQHVETLALILHPKQVCREMPSKPLLPYVRWAEVSSSKRKKLMNKGNLLRAFTIHGNQAYVSRRRSTLLERKHKASLRRDFFERCPCTSTTSTSMYYCVAKCIKM